MKKYVIAKTKDGITNFLHYGDYSKDSFYSTILSHGMWLFDNEKDAEAFIKQHITEPVFILPVYNL